MNRSVAVSQNIRKIHGYNNKQAVEKQFYTDRTYTELIQYRDRKLWLVYDLLETKKAPNSKEIIEIRNALTIKKCLSKNGLKTFKYG